MSDLPEVPPTDPEATALGKAMSAALKERGCTLQRWAKENGEDPSSVRLAVNGQMNGPKGYLIRRRVRAWIETHPILE